MTRKINIHPEQGSFLSPSSMPGTAGEEVIPAGGDSFSQEEVIKSLEAESDPLYTDVVERNQQLHRLLGYTSVLAKTLPAVEAEHDPGVRFALGKQLGSRYDSQSAQMRDTYALHKTLFDNLFAKVWGYDKIMADPSLRADESTRLSRDFQADKSSFQVAFNKSSINNTKDARANRNAYLRVIDNQQEGYSEAGLGDWPEATKAKKRTKSNTKGKTRKN